MIELIKNNYDIDAYGIIKLTKRVFKIKTKQNNYYILKFIKENNENVYAHLKLLNIDCFNLPLKNNKGRYVSSYDDKYFILSVFYKEEDVFSKHLKMRFFIDNLIKLHKLSSYEIRVSRGYFDDMYQYLERELYEGESRFLNYLKVIEINEYHSPVEWLFLLNNQLILNSYLKAKEELRKLKDKDIFNVRVCLNYQNFDLDNILLSSKKIIGVEKMVVALNIFDLKDLFDKAYDLKVDVLTYYKDYLKEIKLNDIEKLYLTIFLMIPKINYDYSDEIMGIIEFSKALYHLKRGEELIKLIEETNN